jgi:hypothetical protein
MTSQGRPFPSRIRANPFAVQQQLGGDLTDGGPKKHTLSDDPGLACVAYGPLFAVAGRPATLDAEGQASGRRTNGVDRSVSRHHQAWCRRRSTDLVDPELPFINYSQSVRLNTDRVANRNSV